VKADINNTVNCFKTIRRRLKEVKIDKLKVFSSEIQDDTSLK
jgi:DNA-binding protein